MTVEELLSSRLISANEAECVLGIPAGSIRAWASLRRLFARGKGPRGESLYSLREVIELSATTKRRKKHARPTRRNANQPSTI